jgi:hypothetical protein
LAFGERLPFLIDIVHALDLRNKILIVDMSLPARGYFYSAMGQRALQESRLAAYQTTLNLWLRFEIDRLIGQHIPELSIDKNGGHLTERASIAGSRSFTTGNNLEWTYTDSYPVVLEKSDAPTSLDQRLEDFFRLECPSRAIAVIFTTIPYGDGHMKLSTYDPEWAEAVANRLTIPYARVDGSGLSTGDGEHLGVKSADTFSERLVEALISAPVNIGARIQELSPGSR